MARVGMDVEAVEQIGHGLQADADRLASLTSKIDATVRKLGAVWQGRDAGDFVGTWWPQHRSSLAQVREQIAGLGQSALNNAAEQRGASDSGSEGSAGATGGVGAPDSAGNGLDVGSVTPWTWRDAIRAYDDARVPGVGWKISDLVDLSGRGGFLGNVSDLDAITSGDPHRVAGVLVSTTATVLKESHNPYAYLSGVILSEGQLIADEAAKADWSQPGRDATFSYAASHPGEVLASFGDAVVQVVPSIAKCFKWW